MVARFIAIIGYLILLSSTLSAQSICPTIVRNALDQLNVACDALGRNQVCYGNFNIIATQQIPNDNFDEVGDIDDLTNIQQLTLSEMDTATSAWGVALMKLQANIPNTLSGQNVTILLIGGVTIESAVESTLTLSGTTTTNARVRREPDSTQDNVINTVPANTPIRLLGRTANNEWLITDASSEIGWVSTQLVTTTADVSQLPVIEGEIPSFQTPMQSFIFNSGVTANPCEETPANGLLVQTPEGIADIQLTINGIEVTLGSTAFIQAQAGDRLIMSVIEGMGRLRVGEAVVTVPAGSFSTVSLDDAGLANDSPTPAESYDNVPFTLLPINTLPTPIEIAPPISNEVLANLAVANQVAGMWTVTRIQESATGCNGLSMTTMINGGGMLIYPLDPMPITTLSLQTNPDGTALTSSNNWIFPDNEPIIYTQQGDSNYNASYSNTQQTPAGTSTISYTSQIIFTSSTSGRIEERFEWQQVVENCRIQATFNLTR